MSGDPYCLKHGFVPCRCYEMRIEGNEQCIITNMTTTYEPNNILISEEMKLFSPEQIKEIREAIEECLNKGHNDTCGVVLSDNEKYPCSCGQDNLKMVAEKYFNI